MHGDVSQHSTAQHSGSDGSSMNVVDHDPGTDRRRRIIGRLVEHYQAVPEPDKWLQAMTLQALRALDRAELAPAEKSPARKEIHAIHREVASSARALQLSRRATALQAGDALRSGASPPSPTGK
jgi:hypothetical protein